MAFLAWTRQSTVESREDTQKRSPSAVPATMRPPAAASGISIMPTSFSHNSRMVGRCSARRESPADADGYSNLVEYWLGSNPTNRVSNLVLGSSTPFALRWQAKPYEVYEVQGSTDLRVWTRAMSPVVPTTTDAAATPPSAGVAARFFKVVRVP